MASPSAVAACPTVPQGRVPLIDVAGTCAEAGRMLGWIWRDALILAAQQYQDDAAPWWAGREAGKAVSRLAPHLPTLFQAMAKGAGVPAEKLDPRALPADFPARASRALRGARGAALAAADATGGCTSFAVAPSAALGGHPFSGQTKDTPLSRMFQFQVLRLSLSDAPSALTLTYPGWLFGHGFVQGGCCLYRNSLYTSPGAGKLPFFGWGLLALHCPDVEQVAKLTSDLGVGDGCGHCSVADERGGVIGVEIGGGNFAVLRPQRGIFTHANAAMNARVNRHRKDEKQFLPNSLARQDRLRELLLPDHGRLTPQLAYAALTDHQNHPRAICRHESEGAMTTATVIAQPTLGLLHVTRGPACQGFPQTYAL